MKILISVMGILGIFSSCTSRKESLTEKKKSTLKEVKMKKDSSCSDTDMLPVDAGCSDKGNDTIGVYNRRIDIEAFDRCCNDSVDGSSFTRLPNGTLREIGKYIYYDMAFCYVIDYPKDSYLCYENKYYGNGNIKSERTRIIYGNIYVGTSQGFRFYFLAYMLFALEDNGGDMIPESIVHLLTLPDARTERYEFVRERLVLFSEGQRKAVLHFWGYLERCHAEDFMDICVGDWCLPTPPRAIERWWNRFGN